jgi:N-acetylmuramoyl-L-alanine amidase
VINSLLTKINKIALLLPILYFLNTKELIAPEIKDKNIPDIRKVVVIDPGHGMSNKELGKIDWGGARYKEHREADIVLKQAKEIEKMLDSNLYRVILTRQENNTNTPLDSRLALANQLNADIFISLHINNFKRRDIKGFEIYHREYKSEQLAKLAAKNICEMTPLLEKRTLKQEYLMLKDLNCPGILIESGYLSNKGDRGYILDTIPDIEKAIVKTIEDYLK